LHNQPETNKALVILQFTQEVKDNGDAMMMLVIQNQSKHNKLFMDALMTSSGKEGHPKDVNPPVEPV